MIMKDIILHSLLEGLGLGLLLVVYCMIGIRRGAVGMVFLYHDDVQKRCIDLGLTTRETIQKRHSVFRTLGIVLYLLYLVVFVYNVEGARSFGECYLRMFIILTVMNLIDRFLIDEVWVGGTKAWIIPGTEDMRPYINSKDKVKKWISAILMTFVLPVIIAGIGSIFVG